MDKYVWHSVRDELPPSDAPMLILMVKHIYQNENDYDRYMRFGFYVPAFGKKHGETSLTTRWNTMIGTL